MNQYRNEEGDRIITGENICAVFITPTGEKVTRYGVSVLAEYGGLWTVKSAQSVENIEGELYWAKENADYWATL